MNSQKFNNDLRKNNTEPDFDLDEYIDQKSRDTGNTREHSNKEESGSFIKNAALILGVFIIGLLYFNDWNPKLVAGNIFGIEELQEQPQTAPVPLPVSPVESSSEVVVINSEDLAKIPQSVEGLEALESLEGLEALAELEKLGGLAKLAELENLSGLSALGALGGLENARVIESESDDAGFPESLETYSDLLEESELNNTFDETTIKELYEAGVPISILKTLKDNNLLETVEVSSLIEGYKNIKD